MTRLVSSLLIALIIFSIGLFAQAPNIVLIIAEDIGRDWIGCYGGTGSTPNINRLARQGIRFETVWNMIDADASMATAFSGRYNPTSTNSNPTLASQLNRNGYLTVSVNAAQNDFDDPSVPFQEALNRIADTGRTKPYFLFHRISHGGPVPNASQYAEYVTGVDQIIGKTIAAVEKSTQSENTFLIFTSASCSPFPGRLADTPQPRSKGLNSDLGAHAPLIVQAPFFNSKLRVSKDLIDFSDLYPTLLEVATSRLQTRPHLDGKSFIPSLKGSDDPFDKRSWIYAQQGDFRMIRDWHHLVDNRGSFHDLEKDPLQQEAVSPLDKQAPHRQERLQMILDRLAGKPTRSLEDRIRGHAQ